MTALLSTVLVAVKAAWMKQSMGESDNAMPAGHFKVHVKRLLGCSGPTPARRAAESFRETFLHRVLCEI